MRLLIVILMLTGLAFSCHGQRAGDPDYRSVREIMVWQQIELRGVKDPDVLAAMRKVERHLFVPEHLRNDAYGDYPLPIGHGQTISQPFIVAFMTEALDLEPGTKVLEIGTGSGYQAAILGELCDSVFTIEIVKPLGEKAGILLKNLGYDNVFVKTGDGYQGWPEYAPFDAVIVTCSPSHVPQPLVDQLAEGGKMVIPVGKSFHQELYILVKNKGKLKQQAKLPVRFVPMVDDNNRSY